MASTVAGGLFNAMAFAGAGFLFKKLDESSYPAEVERHNRGFGLDQHGFTQPTSGTRKPTRGQRTKTGYVLRPVGRDEKPHAHNHGCGGPRIWFCSDQVTALKIIIYVTRNG